MSTDCHIIFSVNVQTHINEYVRVCGNIPELGSWNYYNGYRLQTDLENYPCWTNPNHLILPLNTKLEFKFVIVKDDSIIQWETLQNRKYRCRYCRVVLKADWNSQEGREIVEKKFKSSVYINEDLKSFRRQKVSQKFDPFEQSSESESDDISQGGWGDSFSKLKLSDEEEQDIMLGDIPVHKIKQLQYVMEDEEEKSSLSHHRQGFKRSTKNVLKSAHSSLDDNTFEALYANQSDNPRLKQLLSTPFTENEIIYESNYEQLISFNENDMIFLVTFYLPFQLILHEQDLKYKNFESCFNNHLYKAFQRMNCQKKLIGIPMIYDQQLNIITDLSIEQKELIQDYLMKLNAIPIFVEKDELDEFNSFYCNLYQPIIDNDVSVDALQKMDQTNQSFQAFTAINLQFAERILQVDRTAAKEASQLTMPIIADHRLLLLPQYISAQDSKMQISIFYNRFFPSMYNFELLPFHDEIMQLNYKILISNCFLLSTVICFANYKTGSNFIDLLSQQFNLEFKYSKGCLNFKYLGREIQIKFRSPGIELPLQDIKEGPNIQPLIQGQGIIIAGVDIIGFHQGINLKLRLFKKFVQDYIDFVRKHKIKLIQIITFAVEEYQSDERLQEIQELENEINLISHPNGIGWSVRIINYCKSKETTLYGSDHMKDDIECLFQNAHIYLQTHFIGSHDFFLSEYLYLNRLPRSIICNSSCFNRTFQSIVKYNMFNYQEFKTKLYDEILFCINRPYDQMQILQQKINQDKQLVKNSQTQQWLEGIILDLKKADSLLKFAEITLIHQAGLLKKVAHSPKLKNLNITKIKRVFLKAPQRVIVIEFHTLLVNAIAVVDVGGSGRVQDTKSLTLKNNVYIISSGRQRELEKSLSTCYGLNLFAENGYCYKTAEMKSWAKLFKFDAQSLNLVYRTMQGYLYKTEGSSLEVQESMIIWKYGECSQEFGRKQALDLMCSINSILEKFSKIEIYTCKNAIEVRPQSINKGVLLDLIVQKESNLKRLDLLICIGRPIQDEDLFAQFKIIKNNNIGNLQFSESAGLFSICSELMPTNASFFLKEPEHIIDLIHQLSS